MLGGGGTAGARGATWSALPPSKPAPTLTLTFSVSTRSTTAQASTASRFKRQALPCEACGRAIIEVAANPDQESDIALENASRANFKAGQAGGVRWREGLAKAISQLVQRHGILVQLDPGMWQP